MMFDYVLESHPSHTEHSVIGQGSSSIVLLCDNPYGSGKIAVKRFHSSSFDQSQFFQETEILVKLNHPCILRIYHFLLPSASKPAELHLEYAANGSLERIFKLVRGGLKPLFWTGTGIGIIICGIVLGMRFMHSHNFIHQDLKPSNILIDEDGRSLIGDFGTSRSRDPDYTPMYATGTTHYAAPELYKEDQWNEKVDIFSFGLIVYELVVGHPVFPKSLTPFEILRQHREYYRPEIPSNVLPVMKGLIERCWSSNADDRPSFNEIFEIFESSHFDIVVASDPETIRSFCVGILQWEHVSSAKISSLFGGSSTIGHGSGDGTDGCAPSNL
jgi:serine/threonine protein kinase